jgi:arabinogalactan oligomer / maltooligosaccharide transport system substrate-binding protein
MGGNVSEGGSLQPSSDPGGSPQPSSDPGRSPQPSSDGKSKWDWRYLSSLFIPILVGTIGFGLWQLHAQHQSDQQLSQEQHQSDQQLSTDQQRAAILQTYTDNIRDLLISDNLAKSTPGEEVSQVARVQTLTTLRSLDAGRNAIVFQFLQDAGLIRTGDAISLSNADLSNDNLNGADLSGVDLNGATLTGAHLNGANLSGAALFNANLDRADLSGANLSNTSLLDARLSGANLYGANLDGANLTGAFLGDTDINHAILTGARLSGAILTGAQLNGSHLSGAQLNGADLSDTDFSGADLSDTDLVATDLTQQQLDTVYSCTNAILAAGQKCLHQPAITLTYWYTESPKEIPVIQTLIGQFEKDNPKIHIKYVYMNYYQAETAFINAAEEGNPPDVLRSDVSWVGEFASQDYLLNLDPYITQGELSDYLGGPLSSDQYDGQYYGLPQVTDFLALLYNKHDLQKAVGTTSPPATMADFETDAMGVVQSGAAKYGFETNGTSYNAMPFLYAFGGAMLNQQRNILVNDAGSVAGLSFLLYLQNIDHVMPTNVDFSTSAVSPMVTDFMNGKTAMIFDGPYDISEILTGSSFKNNSGNLGIAPIPACPPDGSMVWSELNISSPTCQPGHTGSPSGGQSYVISAGTLHPIEAYKFISFMSKMSSQVEIAEMNHTLPTRMSAYQANGVSGEQFISEFRGIEWTAVPQPDIPQAGHLFDAFDPNIAAALDDVESATVALDAVADAWKQLLAGS